jgi:hypothetical protein
MPDRTPDPFAPMYLAAGWHAAVVERVITEPTGVTREEWVSLGDEDPGEWVTVQETRTRHEQVWDSRQAVAHNLAWRHPGPDRATLCWSLLDADGAPVFRTNPKVCEPDDTITLLLNLTATAPGEP